jgi:hypothetical protein
VLSHAAYALAACHENGIEEVIALEQLADHAGLHAARLWRTGEDLYLRSAKAVAYEGGRPQAVLASLIIERDYRTWDASAAAAQAASHAVLWPHAVQLQHSWAEIRRHGLDDGPGPAAARYNQLVAACDTLAGEFTTDMPSTALSDLLQLYGHAHKHAIRLSRTAVSLAASRGCQGTAQQAASPETATANGAYQGLPDSVAAVSASAHSAMPQQGGGDQASGGAESGRALKRTFGMGPGSAQER